MRSKRDAPLPLTSLHGRPLKKRVFQDTSPPKAMQAPPRRQSSKAASTCQASGASVKNVTAVRDATGGERAQKVSVRRPESTRERPKPGRKNLGPRIKCFRCQEIHRRFSHCPCNVQKGCFLAVLFNTDDGLPYVAYGQILELRTLHQQKYTALQEIVKADSRDKQRNQGVEFRCHWMNRADGIFRFSSPKSSDCKEFFAASAILCSVPLKPCGDGQFYLDPLQELAVLKRQLTA
eukprot:TRINITY_DN45414_c0_g1_i1.p1 TRINITY_DN45414_c0_g1~~TRINITY_DN45414_c0_g1_i1.p1  ORF type:complete len:235 (+),score=8.19 TRINITY_DN45414_c0_g1_i1:144-848(+)